MAIVKMKRLFLTALKNDRTALLDDLMKLSCIEVSSREDNFTCQGIPELMPQSDKSSAELDNRIKQLSSAIESLERFNKSKKPLFVKLRSLSAQEARDKVETAAATADQVARHIARLNELKNEENRLTATIASLRPYEALDVDLGLGQTARTKLFVGTVPIDVKEADINAAIAEKAVELVIQVLSEDTALRYVFGLYPRDREDDNQSVLKSLSFQPAAFHDMQGTPAANIDAFIHRLEGIADERANEEETLSQLVAEIPNLQAAYDSLTVQMQQQKESERLLYSRETLIFEGWVPEKRLIDLTKVLTAYDCVYEVRDPAEGEEPPIMLENSRLVAPFSPITEMYSPPVYGTVDPNPFVAVSYFVFFGMMLGDAALGLILSIACFTIVKKFNPKGMAGNLIRMLGMCGISAIIWGLLFGSFFGDVIKIVSTKYFGQTIILTPLWFDPLANPMQLLVLSLIFGGIHIFVGMGIKFYMLVREGKIVDAIFDIGFWYALIIGGVGYLFLDFGRTVFYWMIIVSAAGILLTAGRAKKNPIMKILGGLTELYGITGYLSDILSYTRLLALGLCSGVVASVFNTIGTLGGRSFIGVIVFVLVFLFGTALNLFINTLGAYVHSCRLEYVEFFSKFYQPGGRAFEPFKRKTKYIEIID